MDQMGELTDLFSTYEAGDRAAFDRIFALLYPDLIRLARARLRGGQRLTLMDTSALVHELYLRFLRAGQIPAESRAHFMAYTARVMRSVIIDFARRQQAVRRGGDLDQVTLNTELEPADAYPEDRVMEIAEAIDALARIDERLASVVEMQFFAGFSCAEIADMLGVTERTVRRDIEKARLLLSVELR
jgi:RNA polymerase sigma factor (TIGR02999 family)